MNNLTQNIVNKTMDKLEFNLIKDLVKEHCITYAGINLINSLSPVFTTGKVKRYLDETQEMYNLTDIKGSLPLYPFSDVSISIKKLKSSYALLPKELLNIAQILKMSSNLKDYFMSDIDNNQFNEFKNKNANAIQNDLNESVEEKYPQLFEYISMIYVNPQVQKKLLDSIASDQTINDNASTTLAKIRKDIRNSERDIHNKLDQMIHSSYSKYMMDPIVTRRNGRFVIPLKSEHRDKIKGFIHDISSSGSTVFIEPMSVFEINNKVNELHMQENIEIEKILYTLSSLLFPMVYQINKNIEILGQLDSIYAKSMYSKKIKAIKPIITDKKEISFINAKHPLLDPKAVVPTTISIGNNYTCLVITGPNTGGKTVSLKTVGLLCLMAYSGIFVPADDNTTLHVFDNIFADIGDEQSISESLSTFSSHMTNISQILNSATSNSLILLDELGSGTDPIEGANLGISLLEHFYSIGSLCFVTTHYQEIKNYAIVQDGFENAACEFDIENLKPTYRLLIGIPGKSNAFAISKRIGIPDDLIQKAKSRMDDSDINVNDLLKQIHDDKLEIEKEKEEILKNSNQIELLRKQLETQNDTKLVQEKENVKKSKQEARQIIIDAKEEANKIINELTKYKDSVILKDSNKLRDSLNNQIANLSDPLIMQNDNFKKDSNIKDIIKIGDLVFVSSFAKDATVLSLPNKSDEIQVMIGSIKTKVSVYDVQIKPKSKKGSENKVSIKASSSFKSSSISPEINLIGENVDTATQILDKYIDDCSLSNLSQIRVVHGKGSGKLREGIHAFLKKNPHVKEYRLGTYGEGEMGVTVITLK